VPVRAQEVGLQERTENESESWNRALSRLSLKATALTSILSPRERKNAMRLLRAHERPSVFRAKFQNLLLFSAAGMKTSQWKGMRVLIADDQKSVGTSLAEMVGLCHHQVVEVVSTGMEAIQAYDRHRPDVVLMDYRMPKLNGITACRYILAKDPNARVILISGWSAPVEPEASGATAILAKPVALPMLDAALSAAMQPKKQKEPEPIIVDATPLREVDPTEPEATSD
jgi:two-component system, chemotaxis family, chemotaxis protein CheY